MKKFRNAWIVIGLAAFVWGCTPTTEAGKDTTGSSTSTTESAPETTEAKTPDAATAEPAKEGAPTEKKSVEMAETNPTPGENAGKPAASGSETPKPESGSTGVPSGKVAPEGKTPQDVANEKKAAAEEAKEVEAKKIEEQKASKTPPQTPPPSPAQKLSPAERLRTEVNTSVGQGAFVGKWKLAPDPAREKGEQKIIAEMKKQGKIWKGLSTTIDFRSDGTFVMTEIFMEINRKIEGTYKIDKGLAVMKFTKVNGQAPKLGGDKNDMEVGVLKSGKRLRRVDKLEYIPM